MGLPYVYPDNDLSYAGNFLAMMKRIGTSRTTRCTRRWSARSTCSSSCTRTTSRTARPPPMRTVGSSQVDPYSAVAAGVGALYGPLHGGANEAVLRMLREIGHVSNVPEFIKQVKGGEGETKLMGFGHRVYKNYDPRAKVIKSVADEVFEVTGKNPLLDIALELERIALAGRVLRQAQALPERRLLLGPHLPGDGLPGGHVPGAVRHPAHGGLGGAVGGDGARTPEQKIARPRQVYTGAAAPRLRGPWTSAAGAK